MATGPERYGRKLAALVGERQEVFGVLIAESGEHWRARILTYPRMLWSVPGARGPVKFAAGTPEEAERKALEFIREVCAERKYKILKGVPRTETGEVQADRSNPWDPRHAQHLVMRFGETKATEEGKTDNLSMGGLFVITSNPLAPGRKLRIALELESYTIPLTGKVAWARMRPDKDRPAGMGVQLDSPPAMYVRYVRKLRQKDEQDDSSGKNAAEPKESAE
jgi:hypothetical protein